MTTDNHIQGYQLLTAVEPSALAALLESMVATDSKELLIFPDPLDQPYFRGVVLEKYFTPSLLTLPGVRGNTEEPPVRCIHIDKNLIRAFCSSLTRRLVPPASHARRNPDAGTDTAIDDITEIIFDDDVPLIITNPYLEFLKATTPAKIQQALNETVIGQPELTAAVADFLYYHALRQQHPELPPRPLMICGPSGSGKTEVWRAAQKLYGNLFPIKIADGSTLTCDGWSGNSKLSTFVTRDLLKGGILVVDEFDKLARPKHSSKGDNVSLDMQSEFLKLLEGEFLLTEQKRDTNLTSKRLGIVFVGAFESLRQEKSATPAVAPIGFHAAAAQSLPCKTGCFTDEELIGYGIMPEILGRIAVKCNSYVLSDQVYLQIIRGPKSRVAQIGNVLSQYGISLLDVISDSEILDMISASKNNKTGVRWVSAQVESRLLKAIRDVGLFPDTNISHCA